MNRLKLLVSFLFILVLATLPFVSKAQLPAGCNPDEQCPIDSNVLFLILAAILVAGFKYYTSVKNKMAV